MEQDTDYMNMKHIKNNTTDPSKRQTGQETAGGRRSITSTHLGIACLIVLIISLAIAIGLRVQVRQMDTNMSGLNGKIQNMSENLEKTLQNLRSVCTIVRNCLEFPCPSGWKGHNQHCYRLSMESKEWISAKLQCESLDSDLIVINTEQEQNFTKKSIENNLGTYWIGLTDRESEGNWKWVDGTPVSFTRWEQGEPNNENSNENCAIIRRNGWNDVCCTDHLPFICEKRARPCVEAADMEKYCS